MLIYIVRHGETCSNVEGRLQGWSDDALNENGIKLAEITGQKMRGINFDYCISSPLRRAKETADIILYESGNTSTPIVFDDRLKEINMGKWEQKKFRPEEREVDEKEIKLFFTAPFKFSGFPNGENTYQVCNRTQELLTEIIGRNDRYTYLLSTHGFSMRAMLNMFYDDPSDFWHGHVPYNCAVNIIHVLNGEAMLIAEDKIYYDINNAVDLYDKF